MFRTSQKHLWIKSSCNDRFHPHGNIITSTIQPYRSIVLTTCRYKTANLNSRNYYELLGVERTATQKDIKKAFFKLSKEYHPDANSADKSLHEKFVKINEAFTILSKQSTRTTYDQAINSISRYPYPSYARPPSSDWPHGNFGSRNANQSRSNKNESNWNTSYDDKTFYDMLRRRMEYDKQRASTHSYYHPHAYKIRNSYFSSISIILIIIGFGMFLHALQWRTKHYSDQQYAMDPRARHYYAYRDWRRINALKDAEYRSTRSQPSPSIEEE